MSSEVSVSMNQSISLRQEHKLYERKSTDIESQKLMNLKTRKQMFTFVTIFMINVLLVFDWDVFAMLIKHNKDYDLRLSTVRVYAAIPTFIYAAVFEQMSRRN